MFLSMILAFLVCGIICAIAEIILSFTKLTPGHVTSIFVVSGAVLEFFNLYDYIRKIGEMGAGIPICSFGSIMMKGVKESIDNNGLIGIFQGVFLNCGTLIVLSVFLAFIASIFFKPKS